MSYMFDRVVACGICPPVLQQFLVPEVPVVIISNVAKWYFDGLLLKEEWWDETSDFPTLIAPFGVMFMEARTPRSVIKVAKVDEAEATDFAHMGFLVESYNVDRISQASFGQKELVYAMQSGENVGYVSRIHIFLEGHDIEGGKAPMHLWTWVYPYTKDGRIIPGERTQGIGILMGGPSAVSNMNKEAALQARMSFHSLVFVPMLAISFLHSPLVTVERIMLDPKVEQIREKKKNKKKIPRVATKCFRLSIDPLLDYLREEGKSEEVGHRGAVKACRDHFRQVAVEGEADGQEEG